MVRKKSNRKAPATKTRDKSPSRAAAAGLLPDGYAELLNDLKTRVRSAQLKAAVRVNRELIQLYWDIGRLIVERQEAEGWGKSVVERLAADIQHTFPGIRGFSPLNVWRMRSFFLAYSPKTEDLSQPVTDLSDRVVSQAVTEMEFRPPECVVNLPWGHNLVLLFKVKETARRIWYAQKAAEHGWSRAVLTVQIETDLFARQGTAVTNFAATLPAPQSDLAQQTLKDPYVFDFLTISSEARERELEAGLVDHVRKFLLELGAGFAFVGQQVHLTVGDDDFYLDLLFYHLHLRCFVVIDLKMNKFTPEDAGKLNFYLSAVDAQMRHADDQPTIGMVLCKTHDRVIAEYALRDISKPIGVAQWRTQLVQSLPEDLRGSLPTVEEIEDELQGAGRIESPEDRIRHLP